MDVQPGLRTAGLTKLGTLALLARMFYSGIVLEMKNREHSVLLPALGYSDWFKGSHQSELKSFCSMFSEVAFSFPCMCTMVPLLVTSHLAKLTHGATDAIANRCLSNGAGILSKACLLLPYL